MLTETHGHLYRYEVPSAELDEAIKNAENAGVDIILNAGLNLETSVKGVKMAELYRPVYACVGVHPWFSNSYDDSAYEGLLKLTKERKVIAVSEIGLDFLGRRESITSPMGIGNYLPREVQDKAFRGQLKLARKAKLPVIVHHNNSHREVLEALRQESVHEVGGVIHGFQGDLETAKEYINLGFYISIGRRSVVPSERGPIAPDKIVAMKKVIEELTLERLLIETDSDKPAEVKDTAEKIAEFKGISFEKVSNATTSNLKRLLRL